MRKDTMDVLLVLQPRPQKQHFFVENKTRLWVAFSPGAGRTPTPLCTGKTGRRPEEGASRACSHPRPQNSERKAEHSSHSWEWQPLF